MIRFHVDGTIPPADGRAIFVFGSNLDGRHGKGAAETAARVFRAREGVAEGATGWAYAIPTKGSRHGRRDRPFPILPLIDIAAAVVTFKALAARSQRLFFVTRVGCGLAGYTDDEIAPMFRGAVGNFSFAEAWRPWLEETHGTRENRGHPRR